MIKFNFFWRKNIQLYYIDTDSLVSSIKSSNIIKNLQNLEDILDSSNLNKNRELFSNKSKKVIGKFKREIHKNIWIDEFICLRGKAYWFKCGIDSKIKLKGISKPQ